MKEDYLFQTQKKLFGDYIMNNNYILSWWEQRQKVIKRPWWKFWDKDLTKSYWFSRSFWSSLNGGWLDMQYEYEYFKVWGKVRK